MTAIVAREMRQRMRGPAGAALLTGYLAALAAVTFAFFHLVTRQQVFSMPQLAAVGVEVFVALNLIQQTLLIFLVPAMAAGAVAGERDRQTFDLLLGTRLSPLGIIAGKLLASVAFVLLLMVAALPLFSLVLVFGGVGAAVVLRGIAVEAATVVMLACAGLLFSTAVRRAALATALGLGTACVLVIGTALAGLLGQAGGLASGLSAGLYTGAGVPASTSRVYLRPGRQVTVAPGLMFGGTFIPSPTPFRPVSRTQSQSPLPRVLAFNPVLAAADAVIPTGSSWQLPWNLSGRRLPGGLTLWEGYLVAAGALAGLCFCGAWALCDPCAPLPWRRMPRE